MSNLMDKDILRVLITQEELQAKIKELGKQITEDYKDKNLLLVSVLKGSVVLMADLMRAIDLYCKIDFLNASSYGENTTSSGSVKIIKDLDIDVKGYDLLIVEDILDSGRTLNFIRKMLLERNAKSIRICTLLDKPERRVFHDVVADYVGFIIPDEFVVGYGLDYAEDYRNLSYIGALKPEVYTKV